MSKPLTLKILNEKVQKVMDKLQVQESFQPNIRDQVNNFAVRLVALEKLAKTQKPSRSLFGRTIYKSLSEYTMQELLDEIRARTSDFRTPRCEEDDF